MGTDKNEETLEFEVMVIGGGGAGLPAALTAIESGAKNVAILEKRANTGGNSSRASGIFAAESHLQRQAMIDLSRDVVFKKAMEWHRYDKVNPRILRAYINKSADTVKWLEDKGIEFEIGTRYALHYHQTPCWHVVKSNGPSSYAIAVKVLSQKCQESGIQVYLRTSAQKILMGQDSRVSGVLALNKKDGEFEIKTKSVVIATGGFAGNNKLLHQYFPFYDDSFHTWGLPLQGDGIRLAAEAGATIENFSTMVREACFSSAKNPLLLEVSREPYSIWVNKRGERFIDETAGLHQQTCTNAIIQQPGKSAYALYDDKMVQSVIEKGFLLGVVEHRGKPFPKLRENLQKEAISKEWVCISEKWDKIADWMGANSGTLRTTIDEYNSFCDHGYDNTFAKEQRYLVPLRTPPFYAIKHRTVIVDTVGPVRINERMEVLDKEDIPIPGLYAAGVIASGWQSSDYCGDLMFGSALGFSVNSGRIAGENATKFVLGNKEKRK